jgi:hypothetical protein
MPLPGHGCCKASCPWKKPSMAFFHSSDAPKSQGFWGSPVAASCGGRRVSQSANCPCACLPSGPNRGCEGRFHLLKSCPVGAGKPLWLESEFFGLLK